MRTLVMTFSVAVLAVFCLTSCSPTDVVTEYNTAVELINQGDYASALEKAKKCVRMNRDDIDAIKLHVFCAFSQDTDDMEQESALRNLKRMTGTKAKDDYEAFFFLGWGYFQVYNYPEAQQALTTAYNLMPKTEMAGTQMYSKLLYMLGVCYAQSNLPQGLEYFMALKDIAPYNTWPEYYANYAMLAYRLKLYNDAIIWFKLAHRADKTQPQPYFNIAVIYDTIYRNPKLARSYYVESLGNYQKQGNTLYVKKIVGRLKTLGK